MSTNRPDPALVFDPHAEMEKEFMAQYLRDHCPRKTGWRGLSPAAHHQLRIEASRYASGRLAELELRARLVADVHGSVKPGELG